MNQEAVPLKATGVVKRVMLGKTVAFLKGSFKQLKSC